MSKIEDVARALFEKINGGSPIAPKWEMMKALGGEPVWHDLARAAIEAMREPTEAMVKAPSLFETSFTRAWRAMIDEALR